MTQNPVTDLLLCRDGFESVLVEELRDKSPAEVAPRVASRGCVAAEHDPAVALPGLIFERSRLRDAALVPDAALKPVSAPTMTRITEGIRELGITWRIRSEVADCDSAEVVPRRLQGIEHSLLRVLKAEHPETHKLLTASSRDLPHGPAFLQLCLSEEGLWFSTREPGPAAPPLTPSLARMKWDRKAPSRSFLKMEEAFAWLGEKPQAGQRVVDLGAAPGGWSYAFVKRGANVLAVDRGPMKLPPMEEGWGTLEHIRDDGIGFTPPAADRPLDWMVSDMLIAPGVALGLLRKWMSGGWARRYVCNIKLPQQEPYVAVKPVEQLLAGMDRVEAEVRQLYHDRREVTVLAVARD